MPPECACRTGGIINENKKQIIIRLSKNFFFRVRIKIPLNRLFSSKRLSRVGYQPETEIARVLNRQDSRRFGGVARLY